jgi:hypothetical protein
LSRSAAARLALLVALDVAGFGTSADARSTGTTIAGVMRVTPSTVNLLGFTISPPDDRASKVQLTCISTKSCAADQRLPRNFLR